MLIGFIGDIHGYEQLYSAGIMCYNLRAAGVEKIIATGDLDFGFCPDYEDLDIDYAILGNHDKQDIDGNAPPDEWKACRLGHVVQIKRFETVEIGGKRIFCVGGADSTDRARRTPGRDWWPGESFNYAAIKPHLPQPKVDLILTHTLPEYIVRKNIWALTEGFSVAYTPSPVEDALDRLIGQHPAKNWICSHWHTNVVIRYESVNYHVLGNLGSDTSYAIWDTKSNLVRRVF